MIYRHFKKGLYRVRAMAKHSETQEDMIVYSPLYAKDEHLGADTFRQLAPLAATVLQEGMWVRPAKMFAELVERDGVTVPRFEHVPTKVMTLCEVVDGNRILLGYKKRGFGQGKWNGFGGKPADGESLESCVKREMREEIGLEVLSCERRGLMFFQFANNPELVEVPLFSITQWSGEPRESEEVRPQWFDVSALDRNAMWDAMWPDDRTWLPEFLKGKTIEGFFEFDETGGIKKMEVGFS